MVQIIHRTCGECLEPAVVGFTADNPVLCLSCARALITRMPLLRLTTQVVLYEQPELRNCVPYQQVVGDGVSNTARIRHDFGTSAVHVRVFDPENYAEIAVAIKHIDSNTLEVSNRVMDLATGKTITAPIPKDGWTVLVNKQ